MTQVQSDEQKSKRKKKEGQKIKGKKVINNGERTEIR